MEKQPEIKSTRFILAEGFEDAEFAKAVTKYRKMNNYEALPNQDIGRVGGDSGFYPALTKIEPLAGFTEVTDVVLIADNDINATRRTNFDRVCSQIAKAEPAAEICTGR